MSESYEQLALRTEAPITPELIQRLDPEARVVHAIFGLTTEVGELTDVWKRRIYYGREIDLVNAREEIGDILWYLALLCDCLGTSIALEQEKNIAKLRARYPERFTAENALSRDLAAERSVLESAAIASGAKAEELPPEPYQWQDGCTVSSRDVKILPFDCLYTVKRLSCGRVALIGLTGMLSQADWEKHGFTLHRKASDPPPSPQQPHESTKTSDGEPKK